MRKKFIIAAITLLLSACIIDRDKSDLSPEEAGMLPTLVIKEIFDISNNSAVVKSDLISNGSSPVVSYGVCWCLESETYFGKLPSIEDKKTKHYSYFNKNFRSGILNLIPDTNYCVRAYAENTKGINYSQAVNFRTLLKSPADIHSVIDIDNNVYSVITVGSQKWMGENLHTTHYRNGDAVYNTGDNEVWSRLLYGAFRWYKEDPYNGGNDLFYNWYAVKDDRGLGLAGWHIPTYDDLKTLMLTKDYQSLLKLTELSDISSVYLKNGWWSSSATEASNPWSLWFSPGGLMMDNVTNPRYAGLLIRCIKD